MRHRSVTVSFIRPEVCYSLVALSSAVLPPPPPVYSALRHIIESIFIDVVTALLLEERDNLMMDSSLRRIVRNAAGGGGGIHGAQLPFDRHLLLFSSSPILFTSPPCAHPSSLIPIFQ